MNLIEMIMFVLLSAILLACGHLLSHRFGRIGFLIIGVPVAAFWAYVLFATFRASIRESMDATAGKPGRPQ
jgi:hypothetical protein